MKKIYTLALSILSLYSVNAQTLLEENFNYTPGDSLSGVVNSLGAWTTIPTITYVNAIRVNNFGLTFAGHVGSGVGNSVSLANTGQDVYKQFNAVDTLSSFQTVYASALIRVDTAQNNGDHFMGLLPSTSTSNFTARTFIRRSSPNHYRVAINKSTETVNYSVDSFEFGVTYLYVIKYMFNPMGTNNDSIWLFVLPNIPSIEPTTPTARSFGSQNDPVNISRIFLRQGTASNTPRLTIDAIRVATSWANSPLPVSWGKVEAATARNGINISWSTLSETNNAKFIIEHSTNGREFNAIGRLAGAGNSSRAIRYNYLHEQANLQITNYYRIKQVDFDGKSDYSRTVTVQPTRSLNQIVETTPNPFNNTLDVFVNAEAGINVNVELMDMIGKVVSTQQINTVGGKEKVSFNTEDLNNGIYFVRIQQGSETVTRKVIKR